MSEQPTSYQDNSGRAFYYENGRRVYVDERKGLGAEFKPTNTQPKTFMRPLPTLDNDLFPLFGVSLGKTTVAELARLGTTGSINKDTGKPYHSYEINGLDFWYHDKDVATDVMLINFDPMPEEWGRLGFDWCLSYDKWGNLLRKMGYAIQVVTEPHQGNYQGKSVFQAEIVASKKTRIPISIKLTFDFEPGNANSEGTLFSIDVQCAGDLPAPSAPPQPVFQPPAPLNKPAAGSPSQLQTRPTAAGHVHQPVVNNSSSSNSTNNESTELPTLLKDSADPKLYHKNGFRVLELPVEATTRDLTKRRQMVEAAAANGLPIPGGPGRVLPLNPAPDAFATREAVQRLTDPERRLVDEFFWFWAHQVGASREDAALRLLCQDNIAAAEQVWHKQEREQSQALVSTHNLAVLNHLRALEYSERHIEGLTGSGNAEPKYEIAVERALWEDAFLRWVVLLQEEGFWSRLTARIRELDDPRLTTGTARRIRAGLPLALLLINAQLALKAAEKDKFSLTKNQITIMRASSFSHSICENALNLATEPIRTRIKSLSKTATKEAAANPEKANEVAARLLEQSKELLAIVDCLLPENNAARGAVHDDVALAGLDCAIAFGNKTEQYRKSLSLYEMMLPIPASQSAKERLNRNYEVIKGNIEFAQCFFCKRNDKDERFAVEVKMHGDIKRIPIPNGTRTTWRHITVKVPRCATCKAEHARVPRMTGLGGLVGALLGLPGCVYGMNHDSPAVLCLPAFIIIGFVVGNIAGKTRSRSQGSKGVGAESTYKQYARVKELLAEGWTWGENPQ